MDNEDETGTMEHMLAVIDSNSNTTKCHDFFEPTKEDFDNENCGEVIGATIAIKKEDSQTTYKDDDYKYVDHNNQEFSGIGDMVN